MQIRENTPLMTRRIRRILLVCNNYDRFSLEEDGRIEVQITREYSDLNLSNPPQIDRVETTLDALALTAAGQRFDLVITMYNVGEVDVFDFARQMKGYAPQTPVVLLTSFSRELYRQMESRDRSGIDYIFCWNNSTDLIIAIIKLLEDKLNAEHDILESGVQAILLVEDSIRYYSTYLPVLYKVILQQNSESIRDALNETQQILRKRARPKILMATNYEDAVSLYSRYRKNLLGVITDIGFVLHRDDAPKDEKLDAGFDLVRMIRKIDPKMPVLMQSSQESMRDDALAIGAGFAVKTSKTLTQEVTDYIGREFGFGDFVVTDPRTGREMMRGRDLYEVEMILSELSEEMLRHLIAKNYLSKWLMARGIFSVGNLVRPLEEEDLETIRKTAIDAIHDFRINQALGVVAGFNPSTYNDAIRFSKIGEGSLGGKARGLAFINHILQKYNLYDHWEDVRVLVPRTLVITTDYFDRFILENGLQYVINSDITDSELLSEFVSSRLPVELVESLKVFLRDTRKPLAIRSSSKLEDSYYQPFAGVYSTYMIPLCTNPDQMLRLLLKAIKSVYASVYFAASKGYITATANVISEEKMAIIIQEICGNEEDGYYFPTLSGVTRSINFYPVGPEKAEEGIAKVAYGLGKAVVDGEQVLRFSPYHPSHVLQTSTPELTMRDTQTFMYALDLKPERFKTSVDDAVNLARIERSDCKRFRSFGKVVTTWDFRNQQMVDSPFAEGPKYITFSHILKYETFPLADILRKLLEIAADEMKCPVEIEFAADLTRPVPEFDVLQIRPISSDSRFTDVDWKGIDTDGAFLLSENALGTGWIEDIRDIVYVKTEAFDTLKTVEIATELTALNTRMRKENKNYVLIGYGRWGSSIPTLGVPVKWSDISEARVIVECSLENFRVDPSQGSHFFQNLTSFNAGYINIDTYARPGERLDMALLDSLPASEETPFLRRITLPKPLSICIDGKENRAMIRIIED
ncbi:MAG: phosphoenolpyruvate synthase [Bacteroidales bacterium]|nr:phosphoenolpyruvate synthase [Bacteroidales bacterium]